MTADERDIVERLRSFNWRTMTEAADVIEGLRAENKRIQLLANNEIERLQAALTNREEQVARLKRERMWKP